MRDWDVSNWLELFALTNRSGVVTGFVTTAAGLIGCEARFPARERVALRVPLKQEAAITALHHSAAPFHTIHTSLMMARACVRHSSVLAALTQAQMCLVSVRSMAFLTAC